MVKLDKFALFFTHPTGKLRLVVDTQTSGLFMPEGILGPPRQAADGQLVQYSLLVKNPRAFFFILLGKQVFVDL